MLSIIIATRNRVQALDACLQSINPQQMQDLNAQLVVVDNASTDSTSEFLEKFRADAVFNVVVVEEPKPGKARALNSGLAAAEGDILVFTDDDCYFSDDYLPTAHHLFDGETFGFCGGRVLLYDQLDSAYTLVEHEHSERFAPHSFVAAGRLLGANMVFKREVIEAVGPFDPMFGPGTRFRCDDIDYIARASLAGFEGFYSPELVVYHHHGRKPGMDTWLLKRGNDLARGAYYMKFIIEGQPLFMKSWLSQRFRHPNPVAVGMELIGGILYLIERAMKSGTTGSVTRLGN
jgi:glycosyltransferase involved in cell wall biosynthesis